MNQLREANPELDAKAWQAWIARNRKEDAATARAIKIWVAAIFALAAVSGALYYFLFA